jgi:hypothetical protein
MDTGKLLTTVLLIAAAAVAIALAPRLQPAPAQQAEASVADVCVSLGRFECCIKDEDPDRRR